MKGHVDDIIIEIITIITSIALLVGIYVFIKNTNRNLNDAKWNNGICPKDGTSWEYNNSSRDKHWRYDYYICDNGHMIELVSD